MIRCKPPRSISALTAQLSTCRSFRTSTTSANEAFNPATVERAEDEVDVCIVGGGPAGLSAAIRLKQLEKEKGKEIRVVVLEKGSDMGLRLILGNFGVILMFSFRCTYLIWCSH